MYLKSQNSRILVGGYESRILIGGYENTGNLDYFGFLKNIIKLSYSDGNNVVLFKCDWWDVYSKGSIQRI